MLVEDDKEIPICRFKKSGKIEIVSIGKSEANSLSKENLADFYQVVNDCVNNNTPAWYFPKQNRAKSKKVKLRIVPSKAEMIVSYRERADEDLELAKKIRAFEVDLIAFENTQR